MAVRRRRGAAREPEGKESLLLDREALRYWRLQRGFTQQALAQQRAQLDGATVQISYAQIRRIEKDGRAGPASARTLAALLGVELARLRPRDPRQLPCGLPREVSVDFVGRGAEVQAVLAALHREGNVRLAASVEGLPGVGKTELALQVCGICEHTRAFRIFWLDAENPDLTAAWADQIALHLGIEHPDQRERARLAVRAVEALGEPTLLVLDNVERWSASEPWPRPQGRHIRWLLTTRVHRLGERAFEHVEVPALDEASAVELMTRIAGPQLAERAGFRELVRHLAGYTIAVELAAAFLGRFPEVEPGQYLRQLAEGKGDVLEGEVAERTPYQRTLQAALQLLWSRLPAVVRAAAALAAAFAEVSASVQIADACGLDRRLRAQLRDYHLLQGDARRWSMHRLVRGFIRRCAGPLERERGRLALVRGAAALLEFAGQNPVSTYVADQAHFDAALELAGDLLSGETDQAAELMRGIGAARAGMGAGGAEPLLREAVGHYKRTLAAWDGPLASIEYARVQYKLALALFAADRWKFEGDAIDACARACAAAIEAWPADAAPRDRAAVHRLLGESRAIGSTRGGGIAAVEAAISAYRSALEVFRPDSEPLEWSRTQRLLARALVLQSTRTGELAPLEAAVSLTRAALEVLDPVGAPAERAAAQFGFAEILQFTFDWTARRELGDEGVRACRAALEVWTRERMPFLWARAQDILGLLLIDLGGETNQRQAEEALAAALEGYDRETEPLYWSCAAYARGIALRALAEREVGTQTLEQAVVYFMNALATVSLQSHRENWALFQGALGVTLGQLAARRGSSADAAAGVEACRAAVSVLRREQEAYRWANAQQELGDALVLLGHCSGDRGVLGDALACFESAQAVFTAAASPRHWRSIEDRAQKLRSSGQVPSSAALPSSETG